jgi:hypothetical protein
MHYAKPTSAPPSPTTSRYRLKINLLLIKNNCKILRCSTPKHFSEDESDESDEDILRPVLERARSTDNVNEQNFKHLNLNN